VRRDRAFDLRFEQFLGRGENSVLKFDLSASIRLRKVVISGSSRRNVSVE
jgi:hypothetical protein